MKKLLVILFVLFTTNLLSQEFISYKQNSITGYETKSNDYSGKRIVKIDGNFIKVELPDNTNYHAGIKSKSTEVRSGKKGLIYTTNDNCIVYVRFDNIFMNLEKFNKNYYTYYLPNYIKPSQEEIERDSIAAKHKINVYLYGEFTAECIKQKKVKPGMAGSAVTVILGIPKAINQTESKNLIQEQLVYDNIYVYLENGIVTVVQQRFSNE